LEEEPTKETSEEEASEIESSTEETGGVSEEDSLTDEDGASPWEHPARKRDEAREYAESCVNDSQCYV